MEMNDNIKVYDNFLSKEEFIPLQDFLLGEDCPWYFNRFTTFRPERSIDAAIAAFNEGCKFTHTFWRDMQGPTSPYYDKLLPLLDRCGAKHVVKIKANLLLKTSQVIPHIFHTDTGVDCTTVVYYLNTCDGFTHFEDGSKIETLENRAVIFNSQIPHGGSTTTNADNRVVLNINIHTKS